MTQSIQSILNPSIGIQELLSMPEEGRLPQARELASSMLQHTGLEALYGAVNSRTAAESLLCPNVGDGTLVNPAVFQSQLEAILEKLRKSDNPKIRALLEKEIVPLLQNGMLLSAYRGLMLGG
ncbi:MAG: hypothetical protein SPJ12_02150 [Duodenibacillus sp.]|nr:hypothetical protein [Duodenibacillus sp.]